MEGKPDGRRTRPEPPFWTQTGPCTRGNLAPMFSEYLERWKLAPDGEPIATRTSRLLPVRWHGSAAMLKIALLEEERRGGLLMVWWKGKGAAPVLAHGRHAILMERAEGGASLGDIARTGGDDEASRTLCAVLAELHTPRDGPPPSLVPLTEWFEALGPAAEVPGGVLCVAARTASQLLATQRDIVVLHGDIHHGNVLSFSSRGWLAIDPKGLVGERGFDYANIFCNPDIEMATMPGRLARQIGVVAEAAELEPSRLLAWVLAWAGLSAAFSFEDGDSPDNALKIAELAAVELSR
jgi:streptomycin 6-kinase